VLSTYSPAFAGGARAALALLAPALLGVEPLHLTAVNGRLDDALNGQARLFVAKLGSEVEIVLEHPCRTAAECARARPYCPWAVVLDESIDSLEAFLHAHELGVTAAIAHVFASTPTAFRMHAYPFHELVDSPLAAGMPAVLAGGLELPDGPALGIVPDPAALGDPIFDTETNPLADERRPL
jgi:hypothetical protein